MSNPLTDIIPDQARKYFYAGFALIGLGLTAAQAGFAAAEVGQPVWLSVGFAVFGVVAAAFGATAASNVRSQQPAGPQGYSPAPDDSDTGWYESDG